MIKLRGKTAVVTGAASGIGRGLAEALAKRGCHLALVDKDASGLEETAALVAQKTIKVTTHVLDLRDKPATNALREAVVREHGCVDLLINNAGVAAYGLFEQVSEETFDCVMDVNFGAMVRLTRLFLPLLRQQPAARVVNLSSVFGLVAPPGQTAYAASKFAVRGFSHALRHELAGTRVGVTVVHPGGVATQIADNALLPAGSTPDALHGQLAKAKKLLRQSPQKVGEVIVRGLERERALILVGRDARALFWLERVLPISYGKLLARLAAWQVT